MRLLRRYAARNDEEGVYTQSGGLTRRVLREVLPQCQKALTVFHDLSEDFNPNEWV